MSRKHVDVYEKFLATFPPEMVQKWVRMVEQWETDPKAPNPYDKPEKGECLVQGMPNLV